MLFVLPLLALTLSNIKAVSATFHAPAIKLSYGTFSGSYSDEYNISYYRKIPYVAPPVGENRWRAPQPPHHIQYGTYDTDQSFPLCPQGSNGTGSEDCLYLGIYSRPWKEGAKRPVVVEIHGGAYSAGLASFNIPPFGYPTLNASVQNDFIFVYPAYRLNVFGFLPGKEIKQAKDTCLNIGLLDQQAALRWVYENIEQFGGDPRNVSIWGQSAGGGSVLAQTIANGGKTTPKLFSRALASSPYWVKQYKYDDPEAEWIFTSLVNLTGCAGAADSIACMRALDTQTIYNASMQIPLYRPWYTSTNTWSPVVDGDFLQTHLSTAVSERKLNAELVWGMYNTHEGEGFVPTQLLNMTGGPMNSSEAGFDYWLRGYLPRFSAAELDQVKKLYPAVGTTETMTYNATDQRAGLIYRDTVLACSGYWVASAAPKGWQGEYTIPPALHGSEQVYWNHWPTNNETEVERYLGIAGAFSSFLQTGDPNAHKLTNPSVPGVPPLSKDLLWTMDPNGFHQRPIKQLKERCKFWHELALKVPE
ncbi:carboxylesterase [Rhizodiscina lignyota]|uniref:Carboxylic ester hydrolase n=1 Tax=Rhizodiscina lignyota TaxID=1504668 RepID=A0A9P4M574_9PEZI|nr:carboxylesterase [Rhizodiscina lignyota]